LVTAVGGDVGNWSATSKSDSLSASASGGTIPKGGTGSVTVTRTVKCSGGSGSGQVNVLYGGGNVTVTVKWDC
jgi:hypothetical protein